MRMLFFCQRGKLKRVNTFRLFQTQYKHGNEERNRTAEITDHVAHGVDQRSAAFVGHDICSVGKRLDKTFQPTLVVISRYNGVNGVFENFP